jgi:hypothetical protein
VLHAGMKCVFMEHCDANENLHGPIYGSFLRAFRDDAKQLQMCVLEL